MVFFRGSGSGVSVDPCAGETDRFRLIPLLFCSTDWVLVRVDADGFTESRGC